MMTDDAAAVNVNTAGPPGPPRSPDLSAGVERAGAGAAPASPAPGGLTMIIPPASVDIRLIDPALRPASQMRAALDEEAIERYAEDLSLLPPVRLMRATMEDGKAGFWVVDGAHTISAAIRLGDANVRAIIGMGDYHEAFAAAAQCNRTHGMPIGGKDKRARVEVALADPVMKTWSDRKIAECCGVSHNLVSEIHAERKAQLSSDDSSPTGKTVGRDGKARRAPTSRRAAYDEQYRLVENYYLERPHASVDEVLQESGVSSRSMLQKLRHDLGLDRAARGRSVCTKQDADAWIFENCRKELRALFLRIQNGIGGISPKDAPAHRALFRAFKLLGLLE
jgi:hypothetical protein